MKSYHSLLCAAGLFAFIALVGKKELVSELAGLLCLQNFFVALYFRMKAND